MIKNKKLRWQRFQDKSSQLWIWAVVIIMVLFVGIIRIRLLEVPLERDEGEYAYTGQLILKGIPPYKEAYNMKMPGIYAAYALIMAIFGQTRLGIHSGLLLVNSATIVLIFLLAKRLFDPFTGLVSAASFAILSLSQSVQGVFANAEHFVILPALGGILLMLRAIDSNQSKALFWSGLLLGIALLIKQHGAFFIIFAGLYLLGTELGRRPVRWPGLMSKTILFSIGAILPFGLTCLFLLQAGVFDKFWFWTFTYAREYISLKPFFTGLSRLDIGLNRLDYSITRIIDSAIPLWVLAGIGFTALLWNKNVRSRSLFVEAFLIFSFLSICPGLYFRQHYFILLLPAIALLAGIGAGSIGRLKKGISILLVIIALFYTAYKERAFLFQLTPQMVSRTTYNACPFSESLEIAKYIKAHTSKDDSIAVIGSEPQIYFYSDRRSATRYIYTYPLVERHKYALEMQKDMIREIESKRPKFIIFVHIPSSWLKKEESETLIFKWFKQYEQKYYKRVGVVDILSQRKTLYCWGNESIRYAPSSKYWLAIFKRKT